jgi:D-arabinose 1-dehydrogenase-like Zn-dependent alcohol dehydrogenase
VQTALFGNGFPIVPGHEIVGDIIAVSGSEKRWKVGDRVGGPWHGGHDGMSSLSVHSFPCRLAASVVDLSRYR